MRPLLFCFALVSGLASLSAPLSAQARPGTFAQEAPRPRAAQRQEKVAQALHLSEAQRGQIKQIRAKHKESLKTKHAAVRDARQTLHKAMQDPKANEADLRKLHTQVADLRFDLLLELRALRGEVGTVLTPEQREKAAELRGRFAERARMMRGPGMAG
jgi:Spy/CpxP family protein refolding chaperone